MLVASQLNLSIYCCINIAEEILRLCCVHVCVRACVSSMLSSGIMADQFDIPINVLID